MVEKSGGIPLHITDRGHIASSGHNSGHWWGHFTDPLRLIATKIADYFAPAAEASHTQNHYDIRIELPGVVEDDISVHVDHNTLIVSGEKSVEHTQDGRDFFFSEFSYGKFQRSFHLPEDADHDDIKASYTNGVLNIAVGKIETEKTGKKIIIGKT